jgi:hypothetical protein
LVASLPMAMPTPIGHTETVFSLIGANVKTLTCKQLGGTCDQQLSANTWNDMVQVMTKHVMEKHPDVAKRMKEMHDKDPKQWAAETKPKWDQAAEL